MRTVTVNEISQIVAVEDLEKDGLLYLIDFKTYDGNDIPLIVSQFERLKNEGINFSISVNAEGRNFTDLELGFFIILESELKKINYHLKFSDGYKRDYTIQDLMNADKILDELINKIDASSLSPLERYLVIYDYLAKKKYKMEDRDTDFPEVHISRDILSVMNTDYIVCEGYANLMTYLCKNVGIKCFNQYLSVNNNECNLHANNLVYIDDNKYDVHGLFYSDVTWDSSMVNEKERSYTFCLIPLDDAYRIGTAIDVMPFFHLFYDVKNALLKVCDAEDYDLVGRNVCVLPPYYYEYLESYGEGILGIQKQVQNSFKVAMNLYLKNRKYAIQKVREILKEHFVPSDVYDLCLNVPFGSTLTFFVAVLCFNPKSTNFVEFGVKQLLKHKEKPLNRELGPLSGEILPYYRSQDIYRLLDKLESMEDKEINKPYPELDRRSVEDPFKLNENLPFEEWVVEKEKYCNLVSIINKIRNISLYPLARDIIKKDYPKGEPISLINFTKALKNAYLFEGMNEEDANKLLMDSINSTRGYAKQSFNKSAVNSFKIANDNDLLKASVLASPLVRRIEENDEYIKIYTDIVLGKSNDLLNLYLIKEDNKWHLTDSNNINMLLSDYYHFDETKYNQLAKQINLVNDDYGLWIETDFKQMNSDLNKYRDFVSEITKQN